MKTRNLLLVAYLCLLMWMYLPELEKAEALARLSDFFKGAAYRSGQVAIALEKASYEVLS